MEPLKDIWNFIENNPLVTIIGLLGSILTIVGFFKKPKIIKEITREVIKVVNKTKKVIFPTAEDWFKWGEKAEKQNNIKKAIRCYKKAIELKPDASTYCYLGLVYKDNVEYDEAIKCFNEGLKLCFDDNCIARLYSNLGFTYIGKRQFIEAIDCFDKVLALQDIDVEVKEMAIFAMGTLYSDIGNYTEAIKYLVKFIEINNNLKEDTKRAYYILGKAYYNTENFNDAQECFQNLLELKINDANIFFHIGSLYASSHIENYEKTIECLQRALDLGYDSNIIYLYLGVAYLNIETEDTYKLAVEYFKKITDIDIDSITISIANVYSNLGLAYYTIDEFDKSLEYSQKAIDCGDNSAATYYNMGLAYERKGIYVSRVFYDSAITNFKKAIEIEADYASAYYYMGLVFLRKSLLNTKDTAIGVKYIQYADKLGLPQAQEFLENNKELVLNASKIGIEQCEDFILYTLF